MKGLSERGLGREKKRMRFSRLQPTPKMKENDFSRVSAFFLLFIVFNFYRSAAKRKKKNKQEENWMNVKK